MLVAALVALAGCSQQDSPGTAAPAGSDGTAVPVASPSIQTLTPLPQPPTPAATGEVLADLRQSSRDAAAGRMEVWLDNDTLGELTPTSIAYVDPRFGAPVVGDRLRAIPSRSERGFPLPLPDRPVCDGTSGTTGTGRLDVTFSDGSTQRLAVDDPVHLVDKHVAMRCQQLAIAEVADLSWADTVVDGPVAEGSQATLTLVVRPTGVAGRTLVVDTVSGTPVLASADGPFWTVDRTVAGDDPPTRIDLPLKPNRCDPHAFLESGGATAFRVKMHLGDEPVEVVLRMSTAGAAAAIDYAERSCGF